MNSFEKKAMAKRAFRALIKMAEEPQLQAANPVLPNPATPSYWVNRARGVYDNVMRQYNKFLTERNMQQQQQYDAAKNYLNDIQSQQLDNEYRGRAMGRALDAQDTARRLDTYVQGKGFPQHVDMGYNPPDSWYSSDPNQKLIDEFKEDARREAGQAFKSMRTRTQPSGQEALRRLQNYLPSSGGNPLNGPHTEEYLE